MIQPVATVAVNGFHASVLSQEFVRIQIFRSEQHCELLLTQHTLVLKEGKTRPALSNSVMFHSADGRLEWELWGKDSRLQGMIAPSFYSKSGEQVLPPDCLQDAVLRATAGACCVGCRHAHVAGSARQIDGQQQ
jgi:hypothetical protein